MCANLSGAEEEGEEDEGYFKKQAMKIMLQLAGELQNVARLKKKQKLESCKSSVQSVTEHRHRGLRSENIHRLYFIDSKLGRPAS